MLAVNFVNSPLSGIRLCHSGLSSQPCEVESAITGSLQVIDLWNSYDIAQIFLLLTINIIYYIMFCLNEGRFILACFQQGIIYSRTFKHYHAQKIRSGLPKTVIDL